MSKKNSEILETLKQTYYKQVKDSPIKIEIPDIYEATTNRQQNLQIKIFTVLTELDIILNTTYIKKMKKLIIPDSMTCDMDINQFTILDIRFYINYVLIGGWKESVIFTLSDIYKLMKDKNFDMNKAMTKYINNKKHIHVFKD